MGKTGIEWCDAAWNPVTGCSKVSPGCANCYAEGIARRFWGDRSFREVQFHPERLDHPLRWRKPRKIFVNSMSDLWHESITDEQLDQIFAVMALTPQHSYQCLTKRPERMKEYLGDCSVANRIRKKAFSLYLSGHKLGHPDAYTYWLYSEDGKYFTHYKCPFPLINVWIGASVENQKAADERIPLLLQTPAAVRFLSCEPLLGPIDLTRIGGDSFGWGRLDALNGLRYVRANQTEGGCEWETSAVASVDWAIIGGESGSGTRPCNLAWIRSIVQQCRDTGVPCFVKQLGSKPIVQRGAVAYAQGRFGEDVDSEWEEDYPVTSKGSDPSEWPEDLRVREFPSGRN